MIATAETNLQTQVKKTVGTQNMTSLVDGIPSTDMTTAVQTSLGKADTALQEHQDITGKEDKTNKVTSVDENSTNTQYPSAKLFYDTTTDLQAKYETLKNDHPDIEEEGTDLSLQGTGDFDLALSPKGNITQDGEPSPTNPSPVKVIDGEYEVEVENKNLLEYPYANTTKTENGITFTDNGNGTITINGTATVATNFSFETNQSINAGTYTFSSNNLPSGVTIYAWDNWGTIGGISPYLNSSQSSVTVTSTKDIALRTSLLISNGTTVNNFVLEYQLQPGSTALPYALHAQQTKTIDTSPNPLYSEDDYYYKQNGNWYVHNEKIKFNLSRVSSFNHPSGWANATAFSATTGINHGYSGYDTKVPLYCNRLIDDTPANIAAYKTNAIGIGGSGYTILLSIEGLTTSADYVNYFQNNETYLYLPLETPTNTQITNTTLINQLEALLTLTAYQDQTNISQTHNEAQADMKINAKTIMSMRYLQNEIEELKQAILNS